MGCSPERFRTFLVCSNIGLLFVGLAVLILSMKAHSALAILLLDRIQALARTARAVAATGGLVALTGVTGIGGACYRVPILIAVHLGGLGVIVVLEFCLGVVLMVIRNNIESSLEAETCGKMCMLTLDTVLLDYAMPSAGVMVSVIILEAVMIYGAVKLLIHLRNAPKIPTIQEDPGTPVHNSLARNVSQSGLESSQLETSYIASGFSNLSDLQTPTSWVTNVADQRTPSHLGSAKSMQRTPVHLDNMNPMNFQDPPSYDQVVPPRYSTPLTGVSNSPAFSKVWRSSPRTAIPSQMARATETNLPVNYNRSTQLDCGLRQGSYMEYQPERSQSHSYARSRSFSRELNLPSDRPPSCSPTRQPGNFMEVELRQPFENSLLRSDISTPVVPKDTD